MPINIKNYIIEKIKESNPNIDTRPGSVFRDMIVSPLSSILGSYQQDHEQFIDRMSVSNLETLNESELDAVASNFLVSRNTGANSTGFIELFFSTARALALPVNTSFLTPEGLEFKTTSTFSISKFQMEQNIDAYPNYGTGGILVRSTSPGIDYNIAQNTPFSFKIDTSLTPTSIVSTSSFSGGSASENNTTFFQRLKDTVHNKTLASPYAIKSEIIDNFPTVVDVDVIGSGHPLMLRDLTSLVENVTSFKSEDFLLTYSGQHSGTYDKKHLALTGNFIDADESENIAIPSVTGFNQEFSTSMYEGLYKQEDANYAEQIQYILVREFFEDLLNPDLEQPDLGMVLASGS